MDLDNNYIMAYISKKMSKSKPRRFSSNKPSFYKKHESNHKKNYNKPGTTSWGGVASWYDEKIKEDKSFQTSLIWPNLERLIDFKSTDEVLDLACGSGFFSHKIAPKVKKIVGIDIGSELIEIAKSVNVTNSEFYVANAEKIDFLPNNSFDKSLIILAIQNIENINQVFEHLKNKIKNNGKLYLVLNHPAFRIPKQSEWQWNEDENEQVRVIKSYLSEQKNTIDMYPGQKKQDYTVSFHRPLQSYFKQFYKTGFAVTRMEEWISNRPYDNGAKTLALEKSRKEIPLFMFLELTKTTL